MVAMSAINASAYEWEILRRAIHIVRGRHDVPSLEQSALGYSRLTKSVLRLGKGLCGPDIKKNARAGGGDYQEAGEGHLAGGNGRGMNTARNQNPDGSKEKKRQS